MPVGENETVRIPAEQAYGMHRPEMVITMPWQNLPEGIEPEVGQQLQIRRDGEPVLGVSVVGVRDIYVSLGANHSLAGKALTFDMMLVAVVETP
jgi:peptidylprolyl isomerase